LGWEQSVKCIFAKRDKAYILLSKRNGHAVSCIITIVICATKKKCKVLGDDKQNLSKSGASRKAFLKKYCLN
jgi:hypothetical protein